MIVFSELGRLYEDRRRACAVACRSDYVLSVRPEPGSGGGPRALGARAPELPAAPQLPLRLDPARVGAPRFTRRSLTLAADRGRRRQRPAARPGAVDGAGGRVREVLPPGAARPT